MKNLLERGLEQTAGLWPDLRRTYPWVHQAARILKNEAGLGQRQVRRRLCGLLGAMKRHARQAGALQGAIDHFLAVTERYWNGLFHCYAVADLPPTNNGLEQFFGSSRYHERRTTGRKGASPGLVVRGEVRLVAAAVSRLEPLNAERIMPGDVQAWRKLREELDQRRHSRTLRTRFRRDPDAYLRALEEKLLKSALPA